MFKLDKIVNYLFPKSIYGQDCNKYLSSIDVANLGISHRIINNRDLYYILDYEKQWVKDVFINIKLKGNYDIIPELYGIFENKLLTKVINNQHRTIFIIVPSDPLRYITRGFGFNEIIIGLLQKSGLLDSTDSVIKIKTTKNSSKLNKASRTSLENPYIIDENIFNEIKMYDEVIVFDDIITTGSTFEMIADILPKNIKITGVMIAGRMI